MVPVPPVLVIFPDPGTLAPFCACICKPLIVSWALLELILALVYVTVTVVDVIEMLLKVMPVPVAEPEPTPGLNLHPVGALIMSVTLA